jgi:tetratricopeptide (TPR) repeat protein
MWFVVTLLPVIGIIRVGSQAMADRYMYIPITGLLILLVWGFDDLADGGRWKKCSGCVLLCIIVPTLMILTYTQVGYWRNSITLFEHALKVTDKNWIALNNLAVELTGSQRYSEAIPFFVEEVRIMQDTGNVKVHFSKEQIAAVYLNIGLTYRGMDEPTTAVRAFLQALMIQPGFDDAYFNLALAYYELGDRERAMQTYRILAAINPDKGLILYRLIQ